VKVNDSSAWHSYFPDISLFLCTVIWGFSFTAIKDIIGTGVSTVFFIFARFGIASIIVYPLCRKRLGRLGKEGLKAGIFLGILLFIGFVTQTRGLLYTTASKSAFITGLSSVFIPIFLFIHKRKFPEPLVIVALVVAALGLFLLTGNAVGGFNFGDMLTLICAVSFGAQIYTMGLVTVKYDSLSLTFVELVTMTVLSAAVLPMENIVFVPNLKLVSVIVIMAIIATTGTLLVQTWAQKRTSSVRAGLIFCAEPVFAYMFAAVILGERFNTLQQVGGAVIIVAILFSELGPFVLNRRKT